MPRTNRQADVDKGRRTVVLDVEILDRLDVHAARRNLHRNELVRQIVEAALENNAIDSLLGDLPMEHTKTSFGALDSKFMR